MKNIIFDIGMHNGDDTAYYLNQGYSVIAVEANPELVINAKKRFGQKFNDKLVIINKGIGSKVEEKEFYINPRHTEWSSFDKNIANRDNFGIQSIIIETCTVADLIQVYGLPDYLKIDIEGADGLVLDQLSTPLPILPLN